MLHLTPIISLLVFAGAAEAESQSRKGISAIVVGHNYGGPGDATLRFAHNDAAKVAKVVEELGGAQPDNLHLLFDPGPEALKRAFVEARAKDLLLFYFSGHADPQALKLGENRFPWSALRRLALGHPARVKLLVVDACHSGALLNAKGISATEPFSVVISERSKGLVILTSSALHERSFELEQLRGSTFTHHFVSGLRGAADSNGDQVVSLGEIYGYGYRRTLGSTISAGHGLQHPGYAMSIEGYGDLVLARLRQQLARLWFPAVSDTTFFVLDHWGQNIIAEIESTPAAESTPVALAPGTYRLLRLDQTGRSSQQITVSTGEDRPIEVEDFNADPVLALGVGKGSEVGGPGLRLRLSSGYGDKIIGDGASYIGSLSFSIPTDFVRVAPRLAFGHILGGDGRDPFVGMGATGDLYFEGKYVGAQLGLHVDLLTTFSDSVICFGEQVSFHFYYGRFELFSRIELDHRFDIGKPDETAASTLR